MPDMNDFEDRFAERLRAYGAQAARPPGPATVATAVVAGREGRGGMRGGLRSLMLQRQFVAVAAGAAAVVIVAIGAFGWDFIVNQQGTGAPSPTRVTPSLPISGGMWPQTSLEEVRHAQGRADAADPDYVWQVDPMIAEDISHSFDPEDSPFVARFLREELGWEGFVFNPWVGWDALYSNLVFVRCAPGGTNVLYPEDDHAGRCAPTVDELQYETVRLDLGQPGREGPDGIWVVTRWATSGFAQADPRVVEASATARLEDFLDARVSGQDAEGFVEFRGRAAIHGGLDVVPLLYGTSTGAPYDRYEIDVVGGPDWPYGDLEFDVRLLADGGETVVAQPFIWSDSGLSHDRTQTTENGRPVALPFAFFDGEVILTVAKPWEGGFERDSLDLRGRSEEAIVLVGDPRSAATGCESGPVPVDADALARSLESDQDLQVTAPVAVRVGGVDALQIDVVLAPGASECEGGSVLRLGDGSDRRGANVDRGSRMRVYLVDMPEGASMRVLGIAVLAPAARFETVMAAATPVLDSIAIPALGRDP